MTRPIPSLLALGLLLLASSRAGAVLILGDDFNYADGTAVSGGTMNGNVSGATSSFSGAWTVGNSGGTLVDSGGALLLTPTSGITAANRSFGMTLQAMETATGSTTLWMGYAADITTVGNRVFGLALLNGATQALFAGKGSQATYTADDGTTGTYNGLSFNAASSTIGGVNHSAISSTTLTAATTYELLTKIDFTNSLVTFYAVPLGSLPADPSSLTGGVTLSANSVNFTTLAGASAVTLQAGYTTGTGSTTSIGSYDSFRIGTTYADVAAVPEPSVALLTAFGFGLFAWGAARSRFRPGTVRA